MLFQPGHHRYVCIVSVAFSLWENCPLKIITSSTYSLLYACKFQELIPAQEINRYIENMHWPCLPEIPM